jgi:hypothetical protein
VRHVVLVLIHIVDVATSEKWDRLSVGRQRAVLLQTGVPLSLQIPGKGRGLVATCTIPQSTALFSEKPLSTWPHSHASTFLCVHCLSLARDPPSIGPLRTRQQALATVADDGSDVAVGRPKGQSDLLPQPLLCASCTTAASAEWPEGDYSWLEVYREFDRSATRQLQAWCKEEEQAMPLLALRLACARIAEQRAHAKCSPAPGTGGHHVPC